jgi:hypothetical protein
MPGRSEVSFAEVAGLGGIGFVLVAIVINVIYLRARLPLPGNHQTLNEVTEVFATIGGALRPPSVLAPIAAARPASGS